MPAAPSITPWKRGDIFSARHLQEANDVLRALTHISVGKGGRLSQTPYGTGIDWDDPSQFTKFFHAIIQNDSTYSDERYVVKLAYPVALQSSDLIVWNPETYATSDNVYYVYPQTFVASNLAETVSHSHNLAVGTPIRVWASYDRQNPPVVHWNFESGGGVGTGQYQTMSYRMTSQNQAGWDFDRAHAVLVP